MKKIYLIIICLVTFASTAFCQQVYTAEYFIDTDPGLGNGDSITILIPDSAVSIDSIPINITALSLGYHWLYTRVKDSNGIWGHYRNLRFYIFDNSPMTPVSDSVVLTEAAYIIADSIPYSWQGITVNNFTPEDTVSYIDSIQGLALSVGQHTISLRVRDNKGFWSYPMTTTFNVCPTAEPFASYDYYVSGYDLILDNTSTSQDSCTWYFSDGDSSNQVDLVHHFDTAGIYNVQLISKNACTYDTLSKDVVVQGINSISPDNGGNIGVVTVTITGAGFTDSTTVRLVKTGQSDIIPLDSSTVVTNGTKILTVLDLKGVALGKWDVIIDVPGDTTFIVLEGFEVDSGIIPHFKIDLIGPSVVREWRWNNYSLSIENKGNVDALLVPVWFAVPADVLVEFNFPIRVPNDTTIPVLWDTVPPYIIVDTIFEIHEHLKLFGFMIPCISGNSSVNLNFNLFNSSGGNKPFYAWASRPLIVSDSSQILRVLQVNSSNCAVDDGDVQCAFALIGIPFGCLTSFIINELNAWYENLCNGKRDFADASTVWALSVNLMYCIPPLYTAGNILQFFTAMNTCFLPSAYGDEVTNSPVISVINSLDPNNKYGTHSVNDAPYFNSEKQLNYYLAFENADTATAPAQTVLIIDTLDNINLDLNSFELKQFSFADTTILIPPGKKSYTTDIDLRPATPLVARIAAYINDSTGIATWLFTSLDTLTMEPTTDPLLGFLLPNDSLGRGEGGVIYSIHAKSSASTGTIINNKAWIYFDSNLPVATQTWTNIIDNFKPQSQVNSLGTTTIGDSILVSWTSSTDNGPAGVYTHTIYYNINGGNWKLWKYNTSLLTDTFVGIIDSTYGFYSVAIDSALNVEDAPLSADATTTLTVGIEEYNQSQMIVRLFPNPAKTSVSIFIKRFDKSNNDFIIIARDVMGRIVKNEKISFTTDSKTYQTDISHFTDGIYFFEITDGTNHSFKKFIKN